MSNKTSQSVAKHRARKNCDKNMTGMLENRGENNVPCESMAKIQASNLEKFKDELGRYSALEGNAP
jgi:hypothetical protein